MRPGVLDRGADDAGEQVGVQRALGEDRAERDRQPGVVLPPRAEVDQRRQAVRRVGEARLVDDQAGVEAAVPHRRHDLGERNDLDARRRLTGRPEPEQQVRRRALGRHRDGAPGHAVDVAAGEDERPAAAAQRAAGRQQPVALQQPRQRGVGHLHHVVRAALGRGVRDVDVGVGHLDRRARPRSARAPRRGRRRCRSGRVE